MEDFLFRTEDFKPDEISKYFVETKQDREVIDALKKRNPSILVGSRGVGKSFLLRIAEAEMKSDLDSAKAYPVYVTFVRSSLVKANDSNRFRNWMLSRLCAATVRALRKDGLLTTSLESSKILAGGQIPTSNDKTKMERLVEKYENSYVNPNEEIDNSPLSSIETIKEAFEDLTVMLGIDRFCFLIDEAAHIFVPEQQRQFFTLFRDLRSHCVTCKAAIYPGVTSFGETFQPSHDATLIRLERDVSSEGYLKNMEEIVLKQAQSKLERNMMRNKKNFHTLAYACSGNPRILLKTVSECPNMTVTEVNEVLRTYYRSTVWSEHSALADKYRGHREIIDWGRDFIESKVLPEIKTKNDTSLALEKATSSFFWIHRDSPETVKEALRILSYTGIIQEMESGIKATRSEIGTRYTVNLGCLLSLESSPTTVANEIAQSLTPKRMTEFGANNIAYGKLINLKLNAENLDEIDDLQIQLERRISVLDLTDWQKSKLGELGLNSIGAVLSATETKLMAAYMVGHTRARRMKNAAIAAVLEYLSG